MGTCTMPCTLHHQLKNNFGTDQMWARGDYSNSAVMARAVVTYRIVAAPMGPTMMREEVD